MSAMTLYALAHEYRAAADVLADLDMDAQTVADTLESLPGDVKAKAANVARMYMSLDVLAAAQEAAGKAMIARAKATGARSAHLLEYLTANMELTGIDKIEDNEVRISWCKSSAVVIDGVDLIPAEFMRHAELPPPQPDKKAIADAIKAGREIQGAHVEHRRTLQVR
jgi:hypothetical protein